MTASTASVQNSTNVRTKTAPPAARNSRIRELASLQLLRTAIGAAGLFSDQAAAQVAALVFLRPRKFARPKAEARLLWMGDSFAVPYGAHSEVSIPAWRWGTSGPVVVLMHGWEGRGAQLGAYISPLVEAGFQVVAFDAPGHDAAPGKRSSLPEFARVLNAVVAAAHARFGEVYGIVAHSMGGAASMLAELSALESDQAFAKRIVMIAPPGRSDSYTRLFSQMMGMGPEVTAALRKRIETEYAFSFDAVEPWNIIGKLQSKALIVHDSGDEIIPAAEGAELAQQLGAQYMQTQGLGHRRILKDPAVVARTLEFLVAGAGDLVAAPPLSACLERGLFLREDRTDSASVQ